MASNRSAQRDRLLLEHEAKETEDIFDLQNTQLELLKAIKDETAVINKFINKKK